MNVTPSGFIGHEAVRAAVEHTLRPSHFFVGSGRLRIEHVDAERFAWEIFRGHLLDPAHTRKVAAFEIWNNFLDDDVAASAPLLSILWQADVRALHVVRRILTHGFEAYEESPGVILSRPAEKWVAELVGSIEVDRIEAESLESELCRNVFLAVIGTSRLPITSLESPLPSYSLGQFAFVPSRSESETAWRDPVEFLKAALDGDLPALEQAKAIESALRAMNDDRVPQLVSILQQAGARRAAEPDWLAGLFRTVFNSAALSPYTEFADRLLATLLQLSEFDESGRPLAIDVVGYMLRHLCRHLTAFDLTLFHNFGANYPDALFLDSLLAAYLQLIERHEPLFLDDRNDTALLLRTKRLRRRALRQACMLRKQYEGHRVPDAPTSMGENARVLPAPLARVPEEQIVQASKRRRTLFEDRPTKSMLGAAGGRVFDTGLADLGREGELGELGMAHFLDRPLGIFKEAGEVDRTPLLSYEAFSRSLAKRRLAQLKSWGWLATEQHQRLLSALDDPPARGLSATEMAAIERPGVATLADMHKVAPDFRLLRTTRGSLDALLAYYDLRPLAAARPELGQWLAANPHVLLVPHAKPNEPLARATLRAYDRESALRLELGFETAIGRPSYRARGGVELVERLRVLGIEPPTCIELAQPD